MTMSVYLVSSHHHGDEREQVAVSHDEHKHGRHDRAFDVCNLPTFPRPHTPPTILQRITHTVKGTTSDIT